jgi:hypothetical protein
MAAASGPRTNDDYDALAAAVMETERGRWFLAEFARRNRAADTAAVLDAMAGLEMRLAAERLERAALPSHDVGRMAVAISKIAVRAAFLRADLEGPAPSERRVARALRHLALLDRLITGAASAAAGALKTQSRLAAGPPGVTSTPAPDIPRFVHAAESALPLPDLSMATVSADPELEAALAAVLATTGAASPGDAAEPLDDAAEIGHADAPAPEAPREPEPPSLPAEPSEGLAALLVADDAPSRSPERRRLPLAWTPSFLEGPPDDDRSPQPA